jgi:hypothetical protein
MRISKPISEAEADAGGFEPWKAGTYDFTILDASDEVSSSGNEMIKLTIAIYNAEGRTRKVFDYLVDSPKTQFKIRHFASAVGLTEQYEAGELDINEIVDRSGKLKLAIKPAQGDYPAGNQVSDYIKGSGAETVVRQAPPKAAAKSAKPAKTSNEVALDDDSIPF